MEWILGALLLGIVAMNLLIGRSKKSANSLRSRHRKIVERNQQNDDPGDVA